MSFVRYFWSAVVLTIISTAIMFVMVDLLHVHYLLSFWTATIIVFFARYYFMEKYVFKKKKIKQPYELGFLEKHWLTITFILFFLLVIAAFFYFSSYKVGTYTPWMK